MEVSLLASSSKDNTRVKLERVETDSYGFWVYEKINSTSYLLTSGTGEHLVYQALPTCSSTLYPDVGDYKGRTGLSPPAAYPSTVGHEVNKGSL